MLICTSICNVILIAITMFSEKHKILLVVLDVVIRSWHWKLRRRRSDVLGTNNVAANIVCVFLVFLHLALKHLHLLGNHCIDDPRVSIDHAIVDYRLFTEVTSN